MACAELQVSAFGEERLLCGWLYVEDELVAADREQNTTLNRADLDVQNFPEMFVAQRLEHHRLVNAVHELRCELALAGFGCRPLDLLVEVLVKNDLRDVEA